MIDKSSLHDAAVKFADEILPPYGELIGIMDGFDFICALSDMMGGGYVYMPSARAIFRGCIEKSAKAEYNGCNFRELMKKYGYSESQFRKILSKV